MSKVLNFKEKINEEELKNVAKELKNGKVAVFPTETVYGIGTNGLDEMAVLKLYEIKKRPREKAISLLVSDMNMVENLAKDITEAEYKIMKKFFPGPLTIILKKKDNVPDVVTAGSDYVGIRMPEGEIARKLVEYAGVPIATPSANISGMPSGITEEYALDAFGTSVDYYIDSGEADLKVSSTIVKIQDSIPIIVREGTITRKQIEQAIKG